MAAAVATRKRSLDEVNEEITEKTSARNVVKGEFAAAQGRLRANPPRTASRAHHSFDECVARKLGRGAENALRSWLLTLGTGADDRMPDAVFDALVADAALNAAVRARAHELLDEFDARGHYAPNTEVDVLRRDLAVRAEEIQTLQDEASAARRRR